jgi:translation initiation factor IF-3
VRLMIVFRGREIVHPETGQAMLDVVSKEVAEISVIEQKPSMEGRRMVMVLGPRSGVIRPAGPAAPPSAPISRPVPPSSGGQPSSGSEGAKP